MNQKRHELEYTRKPLQQEELMQLVNAIPSNWMTITTDLHAPIEMIKSGEVAVGKIWEMTGKSREGNCRCYDLNDYKPTFCDRFYDSFQKDNKHFCAFHQNLLKEEFKKQTSQERLSVLIRQTKKPCGVSLHQVRGFGPEQGLEDIKRFIEQYLSEGYFIGGGLEAFSGISINQRGVPSQDEAYSLQENILRPNIFNSQEYFKLLNGPDCVGAFVGWNPSRTGKKENIEWAIDLLKKLQFQERINPLSQKLL